jgi:hypothetical protein
MELGARGLVLAVATLGAVVSGCLIDRSAL